MVRAKLYFGVAILSLVVLLAGACAKPSPAPAPTPSTAPTPAPQPAPAPSLKVKNADEALAAALEYLRTNVGEDAPAADIQWGTQDITPPDLVGVGIREFGSDEWHIIVSYPVLPPENTEYEIVMSSIKLGWHWKGSVKADGSVTELSVFQQMSKEGSQKIAEEFLRNSPTFVFDGMEDTLRLTDTLTARCPYCWAFIFEFESRHAGYGDRTGQVLAQVITPHKALITVQEFEIISAVMDDKWDMINQEML